METPNTFQYGLKYGLISGTISLVITFIMYAINPELMFSAWYINLFGMVLLVGLMVMAVIEFRRDNNNGATFGQALSCSFYTFAISALVGFLGQYVLINVIDPSLIELQQQVAIEASVKALELFGAGEDIIEDTITEIEKQGPQTLLQMFFGYLSTLVIGLVISLIVAAFTKKKRPLDYSDVL